MNMNYYNNGIFSQKVISEIIDDRHYDSKIKEWWWEGFSVKEASSVTLYASLT